MDKPVPIGEGVKVRVMILTPEEVHPKRPPQPEEEEDEWLRAAATNPAFDFLKEPEEDIYTLEVDALSMMRDKVVLVPFPFDDFSAAKVRPAVCLTEPIGPYRHIV